MLLIALGTLAAGLLMAAAVQMQWLLRPLQQLRQHLGAVQAGDAAQLQGHYPQELTALVTTLNHVLASNAEMVQRARTQAGNLAHALNPRCPSSPTPPPKTPAPWANWCKSKWPTPAAMSITTWPAPALVQLCGPPAWPARCSPPSRRCCAPWPACIRRWTLA